MRIETVAVHAGQSVDPATGAVMPPIYLSTTFERATDGSYPRGYIYARTNNPNRESFEHAVCALEGGAAAAAFASGSAATAGVFQALGSGDHVIAPDDVYHGSRKLLREVFAGWGLDATFVDMTDLEAVERAIRPNTKLLWVETPSNPLLKVTDLRAVSELAHAAGAICACDNTWATPVLQRPLELGADLVVHSTTKYFGGHSDVTGGMVVGKTESGIFERVRLIQTSAGAVPSPFECWLALRGTRTLPYRMRGHCDNAESVAKFLSTHRRVEAVHYPGLESHPGHDVAASQMSRWGGMVSFQVRGGAEEAMAVAGKTKLFTRATSLGGVESLIEHRASIEGPGSQTPVNLLRLSIGLENADDLVEDLAQALG